MQKEEFEFEYIPDPPSEEGNHKKRPSNKHSHKHKKHKTKKRGGFRFYFLNVILFLCIGIAVAVFAVMMLFPLDELEVEGYENANEAEIEEAILSQIEVRNLVYAWLKSKLIPMPNVAFVEDIELHPIDRTTLMATVTEKELNGYVADPETARYVYYDKDGIVTEVSERFIEGVTQIEGVDLKEAVIGEPLPISQTDLKTLLDIQKFLGTDQFIPSMYVFDSDGTCGFYWNQVFVDVGTPTDLEDKIKRLPYILPEIEQEAGILHLSEWTHENTDIIFEKN